MLDGNLIKRLHAMRSNPHGSGATDSEILQAESTLGLKFPGNYLNFLSIFGWGGFGHNELYGVGAGVPDFLNLILQTKIERTSARPKMPSYLVPLMNDGAGNHYCLDSRTIVNDDCPVVFWNHELREDQVPEIEADSFGAWLTQLTDFLESHQPG